ncbi:MAG: hypothetical protein JST54_00505 [Deltaproteobacteria bacterium]|nr:hypothetical protein [Deltaproteobacteria bacterium]
MTTRGGDITRLGVLAAALLAIAPSRARAQAAAVDAGAAAAAVDGGEEAEEADGAESEDSDANAAATSGYTPPSTSESPLTVTGYVDLGFAHATGNGSSFPPNDTRLPADYGEDPFAPAVNSRGDVASTDSNGHFVNHFLPYSMNIGNRPSFLINTVSADVRFAPSTVPVLLFTRVQALPRFFDATGDVTQVVVEQAFARLTPIPNQELAITAGKFDPVFGIEYLENEANLRTGIVPSLIARYTTGQQLGVKAFYRYEFAPIWSALSLNVACTNGSSEVPALQTNTISLTGSPDFSARLGYELNLPSLQVKLGASGLLGPRNDQLSASVQQRAIGFDARLFVAGLTLAAEGIDLHQDAGTGDVKLTGTGEGVFATEFYVRGWYVFAGYALPFQAGPLHKVTLYGRYDRRHANFDGFADVLEDRYTAGFRVDLWDSLAIKGELVFNQELRGAPNVDNNVQTSSLVYTW